MFGVGRLINIDLCVPLIVSAFNGFSELNIGTGCGYVV